MTGERISGNRAAGEAGDEKGKRMTDYLLKEVRDGSRYSWALFSKCGVFRYALGRHWEVGKPHGVFICLNPSTADESKNDPTVKRCITRLQRLGFGSFVMLNLFAFRATKPTSMKAATDPVGPANNEAIETHLLSADLVVCGWGTAGGWRDRDLEVMELIRLDRPQCLKVTKDGYPQHPLYVGYDVKLKPYGGRDPR